MAVFSSSDRAPVDAVVRAWRSECLIGDRSLLFAEKELWTAEHAQELVTNFNEHQLHDEASFEKKLEVQLSPVTADAKRLMAEIIAVYFFSSPRTSVVPANASS